MPHRKVFRAVDVAERLQQFDSQRPRLSPAQGCFEDAIAAPGDAAKQRGLMAPEADQVISAIGGRAEDQIIVVEVLKRGPQQCSRDSGTVGPNEDSLPDAVGERFPEGSLHAAAEVAGPLRNIGEIASERRRHLLHVASLETNLDLGSSAFPKLTCPCQRTPREIVL